MINNSEIARAKAESIQWAKDTLSNPKTLIVDLETTGILNKDPDSEIVQITIINLWEKPLLNMLVRPNSPIGWEALRVHKITTQMVENSPTFKEISPLLCSLIEGKHLVSYKADFDIHFITHMLRKYGFDVPNFTVSCAMENYSKWQGDWNETRGSWKWHKLPSLAFGEAHDSFVDCISTLRLIRKMAGEKIQLEDPDMICLDF